jgi:hypothetical protein
MRRGLAAMLALGVLFGGARESAALTFFQLLTGDEGALPDARSVALGRTRVSQPAGAFTGATNPAMLSGDAPLTVAAGGSAVKVKETRSIPAYDSFDAYLVESIYVLNNEVLYEGGIGGTGSFGRDWIGGGIGAGFSWAPVRDFQYAYLEEVRDNDSFTRPRDQLIGMNEIESTGGIAAFTGGLAIHPHARISLGASAEWLHGHFDLMQRTQDFVAGTQEIATYDVEELGGWRALFGATVHAGHRLDASFTWRTFSDLEGDYVRTGDAAAFANLGAQPNPTALDGGFRMHYPQEVTLGASWRPRAKSRTVVRGEAAWVEWSDFRSDFAPDATFDDLWDVRFGVEHVFYNDIPMRFGFLYTPAPRDDQVAATAFTFGAGFPVGALKTDLAFEFGNRKYRYDDLFPDSMYGGNDRVSTDRVEEAQASMFVTLGYAFSIGGE